MNKHATDIVAYITWVGLLIALLAGSRESRFHKNQALVIWIANTAVAFLSRLPLVGGIIGLVGGLVCLVGTLLGLYYAIIGVEKPVPVLGSIHLL